MANRYKQLEFRFVKQKSGKSFTSSIRIATREIYTINIPKGALPITKKISEKRETTFGELELSLTYTKTQIVVKRKILIRSSLILPPDYEVFAEIFQLWNSDKTKEFYIEVK